MSYTYYNPGTFNFTAVDENLSQAISISIVVTPSGTITDAMITEIESLATAFINGYNSNVTPISSAGLSMPVGASDGWSWSAP